MKKQTLLLTGVLLIVMIECVLSPSRETVFETERFRFTVPAGWGITQNGRAFYNLGLTEVVMIHDHARLADSSIFFAVATSPLAGGAGLEERFTRAYQTTEPKIVEISRQPFARGGLSGYEIIYKRPWGEPWWQFRDIWLEKDGVIYVLSFHTSPFSFAEHQPINDQIVDSFSFKD
jgi:hypothetical protein